MGTTINQTLTHKSYLELLQSEAAMALRRTDTK